MSSLQNKLLNSEAEPPAGVWDKIAAALDEPANEQEEYASKLYNFEIDPPVGLWQNIGSALDADNNRVATPVRKMPFLRYAAAAVLIAALAFGVFKWTGTGNIKPVAQNTGTITPSTDIPAARPTDPVATTDSPADDNNKYAALDKLGKANMNKLNKRRYSSSAAINAENAVYAYDDLNIENPAERYVMLMTPEGSIIRMSKKLGNLICCVSGEEQGDDCRDQLRKWQQKIAASSLAPSPANFLDILSLVSSLDDTEL
jgi:hypothetical protein